MRFLSVLSLLVSLLLIYIGIKTGFGVFLDTSQPLDQMVNLPPRPLLYLTLFVFLFPPYVNLIQVIQIFRGKGNILRFAFWVNVSSVVILTVDLLADAHGSRPSVFKFLIAYSLLNMIIASVHQRSQRLKVRLEAEKKAAQAFN